MARTLAALAGRLSPWLACLALASACVQRPMDLPFGFALPLSTAFLLAACLAALPGLLKKNPLPPFSGALALFLILVPAGFLGMHRGQAKDAVKESIQIFEIFILAPWLFFHVDDRTLELCRKTMAAAAAILPVAFLCGLMDLPPFELSAAKCGVLVLMGTPFLFESVRRPAILSITCCILAFGVGLVFGNGGMILAFLAVALIWMAMRKIQPWTAAAVIFLALAASLLHGNRSAGPWNALDPSYGEGHAKRIFIEYAASMQAPLRVPFGGGLGQYKDTINMLREYGSMLPHPDDARVPRDGNCQYLLTLVECGLPAAAALFFLFFGSFAAAWKKAREEEKDGKALAVALSWLGLLLGALFCVALSRGSGIWAGALLGMSFRILRPDKEPGWKLYLPPFAWIQCFFLILVLPPPEGISGISAANARASGAITGIFSEEKGPEIVHLAEDGALRLASAVHLEAENCSAVETPMRVSLANGASGNRALEIPQRAGKGVGKATYSFRIEEDGDYILYARVWWEDGCSNSLGFAVGDDKLELQSSLFLEWHELDTRKGLRLMSGEHTLTVINLEDGVKLDYWGLRRLEN